MKAKVLWACALTLATTFVAPSSFASGGSLSGTVGTLSATVNGFAFPLTGKVGSLTLNALLILPKRNLALLSGGIPVVGSINVQSYLQTVQAIGVLQKPLAGLGVVNGTFEKLLSKSP